MSSASLFKYQQHILSPVTEYSYDIPYHLLFYILFFNSMCSLQHLVMLVNKAHMRPFQHKDCVCRERTSDHQHNMMYAESSKSFVIKKLCESVYR